MASYIVNLLFVIILQSVATSRSAVFDGKFPMDTGFVNITSSLNGPISVLGISTNCYQCPLQLMQGSFTGNTFSLINTHYRFVIVIENSTSHTQLCRLDYLFGEKGWYKYSIDVVNDKVTCHLSVTKQPKNPYWPLLWALCAYVALTLLCLIWCKLLKERCQMIFYGGSHDITMDGSYMPQTSPVEISMEGNVTAENISPTSLHPPSEFAKLPKEKRRLRSLDTFRGIAITLMIFVNFGGGGYYFFGHAAWNGLLVADLVFPWFIWIMGVSITLSFKSLKRRKVKKWKICLKVIRRSLILFGLGLFTSNFNDLETYRIPGVLQRFAACYIVIALMQLFLGPSEEQTQKKWWDPIRDVVSIWKQWLAMLLLLAIYVTVTYAVKLDGCPRGYTGPGGIGRGYPEAFNCTGGVANYIDRKFFGKHIYQWPTVKQLYKTKLPHEPEGFLGTLTSIFLVFLGVQAGRILHTYRKSTERITRWLAWGVFLGLIGVGLCKASENEGVVPINKNLWSVSFILVTGSSSFFLLTFCYIFTDSLGWWNGAPFFYPGMNSILLYVGHGILYNNFPFSWKMDKYGTHSEKLAMNLLGTSLWVLISYYLYRKKTFLKI
ncbi:heparan-alpha-glucosaminide N-acetyltransferase isoform X2 [Nematostella vectensis]|uniref:heparan-alpha-glucosaminide N-acetyltransferase isoform X2 n=1 Tax=Nematostella vectensis TaxID=45351 RepID=UPI002076F3A1|nr:heparan-alpha-glucosaminide N-acetyltransferase isoform X2 [Nematostella vectensis]